MSRSNIFPKNFVLFFILLFLMISTPALSQSAIAVKEEGLSDNPIVIKSDTLEFDNKKRTVLFSGSVDANIDLRENSFNIKCEKMFIHYIEEASSAGSNESSQKIEKIIAHGKVKIIGQDEMQATAEKAVYFQAGEKLVLTGKPVVRQGDDFVEGAKITLFLKEDRSVVEGAGNKRVKAFLSSRGPKR